MSYSLAFTGITLLPYVALGGILVASGLVARVKGKRSQ